MKNKVFIIAEAGVNHNGNPQMAREMVQAAFDAGADAVKFQTYKTEKLVSPETPLADYQKIQQTKHQTQFSLLKQLELSNRAHQDLFDFCRVTGIEFMSTPFDIESAQLLKNLGVKRFKIGSGDLTNLPLLRKVGQYRQEIILSTGMGTLKEIRAALKILTAAGTSYEQIVVLHANTEYPTPFEDVNLRAMLTIAKEFNTRVGYSDHTAGIEVPVAAVALGASVIEKHFTLDRDLDGPDHRASLEPDELKAMITAIRHIEKSMGHKRKEPSKSERKNMAATRKSIVASRDITKGELLSETNLTVKRPGIGISPLRWDDLIGTPAVKNYTKNDLI